MNSINTKDLKPGQVFSAPVYTEGDYLLVTAMVPLRQRDIDVLTAWDIEYVRTDGALVDIDALAGRAEESDEAKEALRKLEVELAKALADAEEMEEVEDIPEDTPKKAAIKFSIKDVRQNSNPYRVYKNLIEVLNKTFNSLKAGREIEMRAFDDITVKLIQELNLYPDSFIGFILGGEVSGNELAKSSVNTAILSAMMAQEIQLHTQKIHNIVSGALLHDVGMLRLSKGITEKKGGLSALELEQIKSHPLHTSKIVTKELFGPSEVNLIALHHHERWDGNGYPDSLAGNAIDIGARIVSVADAFEAMVSKKSYRDSMIGYQAIKNLMADNGRRFDPAVIIAITKIMGIYPIGSIVRLNDSSIARVVTVHKDAPMRPIVQMLADSKGRVVSTGNVTTVDLLETRNLFIKEAIDPAEYEQNDA
jgi:HD-GYP domain-containing protein (c-di-GMP phosphodiesterase class II)